ncbi:MAG: hypothetical protein AAB670_00775, partial [Patescibacteria group bacterium]
FWGSRTGTSFCFGFSYGMSFFSHVCLPWSFERISLENSRFSNILVCLQNYHGLFRVGFCMYGDPFFLKSEAAPLKNRAAFYY